MTIYRSRGLRELAAVILVAGFLASGCAMSTYKHRPFEVNHYEDTNGDGSYDTVTVERHDVLTDRKTGAKGVIKLEEETREMTEEEIENIPPK